MWNFMSSKVIISLINCHGSPGSKASMTLEWEAYPDRQENGENNNNATSTKTH